MTEPVCEAGNEVVVGPLARAYAGTYTADASLLAAILPVVFDVGLSTFAGHVSPSANLFGGLLSPSMPSSFSERATDLARVVTFEGGSNEARTRQIVGRKMDAVWRLRDGWQGVGSLAPSRDARDFYLTAVQVLPPRYLAAVQPTPLGDGGLHMEWAGEQNEYSAEITHDGQLILNVFAADAADDSETIIDHPTREDLVAFVCRGV
jgi:hypothetical protein